MTNISKRNTLISQHPTFLGGLESLWLAGKAGPGTLPRTDPAMTPSNMSLTVFVVL
jgi:hypothetical protein